MRLVDSKQMQEMDGYTIKEIGVPSIALMENAARSWVEGSEDKIDKEKKVYIFCGAGNNGGDGYAIARNLTNRGFNCTVISVKPPKSEDCRINSEIWMHYGITISWKEFLDSDFQIADDDIIIDAVLGTGIETEIRGQLIEVIEIINRLPGIKMAVDLPSGISASTGDIMGVAVKADYTVTFQKEKIGHHLFPGREYSGKLICQNISIPERFNSGDTGYYLVDCDSVKEILPERRQDSYKNLYGHLLTWCGTPGTLGASFLASFSALKVGVGLTTAALPEGLENAFLARAPELMSCQQREFSKETLERFDAVVIGCGLGREQEKWNGIEKTLEDITIPYLLDADAFFGIKDWERINLNNAVLTPHPGEFAQMTGLDKPNNNKQRIEQGLQFIEKYNTTLLLKGAPSIVFSADGDVFINSTGNSGMSTAGSGDVLSGIIGGLLAQGIAAREAALLGMWLHGKSGDIYAETFTQESLTASGLIDCLEEAVRVIKES